VPTMPLEARGLEKTYRGVPALRGLGFTLMEGEVLGFVGPNGAGKTTTIKIVMGLVVPDRGRVLVDGVDALRDPYVRGAIGYVPEVPVAPRWARVCEFMVAMARLEGVPAGEARPLARRALERLGVEHLCGRRLGETSKGQRKRILLALAIMTPRRYVLLDEPLSGLDPEWVAGARRLIRELRDSGVGVLVSSHILRELEEVVDRVLVVLDGRKVFEGSTGELARMAGTGRIVVLRPASVEAAARVLGEAGLQAVVEGGRVRVPLPEGWSPSRVIRLLEEAGVEVHDFEYSESPLEEAYLRLVRGGAG